MQWTRVELKSYAKDFLRKHYWKAFVVCLIFTMLTGGDSSSSSDSSRNDVSYTGPLPVESQYVIDEDPGIWERGTSTFVRFLNIFVDFPLGLIGSSVAAFVGIILFIISIFIGPLITVGKNRFFLKGFEGDVSIRYLFSTFNSIEAWGIFKCIFITGLKNFLWTLLFIIPGIIKAYEYSMVPYLLTKDPNLTSAEAIEISRELTDDHKFNIFVLDLSFIGWYILGILLFGIGIFFVTPYPEAAKARLFNVLSGNDDENTYDDALIYE